MKTELTELQLGAAFERHLRGGGQLEGFPRFHCMTREMRCEKGRPDLVASPDRVEDVSSRWPSAIEGLGGRARAQMLSLLDATEYATVEQLVESASVSPPVAKRALRKLKELGLLRTGCELTYALCAWFVDLECELWAFEFKLSNWKRALYQALQYRSFAHYSVVVVAEQWLHRLERRLDWFENYHLGVVAVDVGSMGIRTILPPGRMPPRSRFHYLYALGQLASTTVVCPDAAGSETLASVCRPA